MAILPNEDGFYRVLLTDASVVQEAEAGGGEYTFWKNFDKKTFRDIIEGEEFQTKLKNGSVKGELINELPPRGTIPAFDAHHYLTINPENVCFRLKDIQVEEIPFDENFEVWGLIELKGAKSEFLKQELERDNQIPMFGLRGTDILKKDGKRHLTKILTFDWLASMYRDPNTHEVFIYSEATKKKLTNDLLNTTLPYNPNLIQIKFLDPRLEKWCPEYKTSESAGMDICACVNEPITILPETVRLIPTGFALNIDNDKLMATLHPRSGLGHNEGIVLGNLTGIIDSDYQGQLHISVWNRNSIESGRSFTIQPGDRIAQMIFVPVVRVTFSVVEEFSRKTERGDGGFGHTGK